jgi:hypothetical protein
MAGGRGRRWQERRDATRRKGRGWRVQYVDLDVALDS